MLRFLASLLLLFNCVAYAGPVVIWNGTNAKFLNSNSIVLPAGINGLGSILFSDGTKIAQDVSFPLSWDNTNKRFNIGATGTGKLNVTSAGGTDLGLNVFSTSANNAAQIQNQSSYSLALVNAASNATSGSSIGGAFSRGTLASRTQSLSGDQIFSITGQGYTGSAFGPGLTNAIVFVLSENTTSTHNGGEIVLATTPNAALLPVERIRITNTGIFQIKDGHYKSIQTTAPTTTVSANAGTGATCTIANATDIAGTINLTEGSGSFAAGTQCTINFNKTYSIAPICIVSIANALTSNNFVQHQMNFPDATVNGFTVDFGIQENNAGNVYKYKYFCMETQ